jgi:tetratricopeptide (TPR) repeat protein
MYDKYPEYDIPEQNIIQKFFTQRWSAIIIEIAMTLVITIAAGRALDPFGTQIDSPEQAQTIVEPVVERPLAPSATNRISTNDISVDTIKEYGLSYIHNQQYPEAAGIYDLAVVANPNDVSNYAWRGYANINAGEYVEAQADYNTVVAANPDSFDGHNSLCWAYGELAQFDKSLEHCNQAIDLAVSSVDYVIAYENRCWVYVEMGNYEDALSDCMEIFEIQPNCTYESCALAHYNLGRILLAQGEDSLAIEQFNHAYHYGSQYEMMYLDIAQAYDTLGYHEAALASYAKYIQLAGENANPVAQLRITALGG